MDPFRDASSRYAIRADFGDFLVTPVDVTRLRGMPRTRRDWLMLADLRRLMCTNRFSRDEAAARLPGYSRGY